MNKLLRLIRVDVIGVIICFSGLQQLTLLESAVASTHTEDSVSQSMAKPPSPNATTSVTKSIIHNSCLEQCHRLYVDGETPKSEDPSTEWASCSCDYLFCNETAAWQKKKGRKMIEDNTPIGCYPSTFAVDILLASLSDSACDASHCAEFSPDPKWDKYRLGDAFLGRGGYELLPRGHASKIWRNDTSRFENLLTYASRFNESLEYDYHKAVANLPIKYTFENYDVLYRLVKDRLSKLPSQELPPPNTLVIHLRLGDVVDHAADSVRDLLLEPKYFFHTDESGNHTEPQKGRYSPLMEEWNIYVRPLSYYYGHVVQQVGKMKYKHVVLMGSTHENGDFSAYKSCQFTKALQLFLSRMLPHVQISLRVGHAPDEDVLFATSADHFLSAGGGFSRIIGRLRKKKMKEAKNK
jgi:hypothetical protein